MVNFDTFNSFKKNVRVGRVFCVDTLEYKLSCSRPTATNLISNLLTRKMVLPEAVIGDRKKWYRRVK